MHKIKVHEKKHLLVIHLNGFQCSNREVFVLDIERFSRNLPYGFSSIITLSKYSLATHKDLHDLGNLLYAYGSKTIVYVGGRNFFSVPKNNDLSCIPMNIRIHQANNIEEAEKLLFPETES